MSWKTATPYWYAAVTWTRTSFARMRRYYSIYGVYGISVFAAWGITVDELAQQLPLVASID
jgi:hypothetical protein